MRSLSALHLIRNQNFTQTDQLTNAWERQSYVLWVFRDSVQGSNIFQIPSIWVPRRPPPTMQYMARGLHVSPVKVRKKPKIYCFRAQTMRKTMITMNLGKVHFLVWGLPNSVVQQRKLVPRGEKHRKNVENEKRENKLFFWWNRRLMPSMVSSWQMPWILPHQKCLVFLL